MVNRGFSFLRLSSKEIGNFWNALHDTKGKFVICWIDFWSIIKNGHWKNFFNIYKQTRDLASEKALLVESNI